MKKNLDTPVIVVDGEHLRPMAWDGDQFVFIDPIDIYSTKTLKRGVGVKAYKRVDARELVQADFEFRKKNNFSLHGFKFILANVYSKAGWEV